MMKGAGFSLWLAPEPRFRVEFSRRMGVLAGFFEADFAQPHITLAGSLKIREPEVLTYSRSLAASTPAGEVVFTAADHSPEYFRSFYLCAEPGSFLSALRSRVESTFSSLQGRTFCPHMSLLYGRSPSGEMFSESLKGLSFPFKIPFHRLDVVKTEGFVRDWRLTASFPLKGTHG